MLGLGLPPKGSYQGDCAHSPMAVRHVPPESGSLIWGKGSVAGSSILHWVLPREVTHARPRSHIPLLWADDTWGRVASHLPINLPIPGPRRQDRARGLVLQAPPPGLVFSTGETT